MKMYPQFRIVITPQDPFGDRWVNVERKLEFARIQNSMPTEQVIIQWELIEGEVVKGGDIDQAVAVAQERLTEINSGDYT
jgi:hypothetical protein